MGKTKKANKIPRKIKKDEVLNIDSTTNIPKLEQMLQSGNMKFIMVYGEWCGACHKFRRDIWNPMTKTKAIHNRAAVRDDMVGQTSLKNAKFDYLPSIIVVDDKGEMQTFNTPEGKQTNAMPTPKNLNDMKRVANVPIKSMNSPNMREEAEEKAPESMTVRFNNSDTNFSSSKQSIQRNQTPYYNYEGVIRTRPEATPRGQSYIPIQGGGFFGKGSLLSSLENFTSSGGGLKIVRQTRRKSKSTK
jgi:thiol-disulfide isomerase/thioredoxin